MDEIIDNLYIGNRYSLEHAYQFALIVNCTQPEQISIIDESKTIRIPIDDIPEESDHLTALLKDTDVLHKIHDTLNKGNKVLVHCNAGRQRSCATVACYLIKYYQLTPIQAVSYIKSKRKEAFFGYVNFYNTINNMYINK
jgi:protein-tyrosine phosphatase